MQEFSELFFNITNCKKNLCEYFITDESLNKKVPVNILEVSLIPSSDTDWIRLLGGGLRSLSALVNSLDK